MPSPTVSMSSRSRSVTPNIPTRHTLSRRKGVSVIDGYKPMSLRDYGTGSATVEVTDGALTLASKGTNTKIQWVRISATSGADVVPPQVSVALDGGGPSTRSTDPVKVTGNGPHEVVVTAADEAGSGQRQRAQRGPDRPGLRNRHPRQLAAYPPPGASTRSRVTGPSTAPLLTAAGASPSLGRTTWSWTTRI